MSREVMQQALEALESIEWHGAGSCWVLDDEKVESAEAALREALAQPEREHLLQVRADRDHAWKMRDIDCGCDHNEYCEKCWPLEFRKGGYWDQREALAAPPSATHSADSAGTFCNEPEAIQQIVKALRQHELILVRTASSYHVMSLNQLDAYDK